MSAKSSGKKVNLGKLLDNPKVEEELEKIEERILPAAAEELTAVQEQEQIDEATKVSDSFTDVYELAALQAEPLKDYVEIVA